MNDQTPRVRTALPSSVHLDNRPGVLPRLLVKGTWGTGAVYFQGAHVAAWHPAASKTPVLWMSKKSSLQAGKAIRGGVPICFPWFGPHPVGTAPLHGFARVLPWTLVGAGESAEGTTLELELAGEGIAPEWPHRFVATHRIRLGAALRMALEVRNTGSVPFSFEEALHSYFGVGDVRQVRVTGLERTEFLDKVGGFTRRSQGDDPVRFTGETDRIYLDTRAACVIHDPAGRREITIAKTGSDATVVWNPWIDKARAMPDFGDEEWPEMVCVETCNVNVHARTLAPGESHVMTAELAARDV